MNLPELLLQTLIESTNSSSTSSFLHTLLQNKGPELDQASIAYLLQSKYREDLLLYEDLPDRYLFEIIKNPKLRELQLLLHRERLPSELLATIFSLRKKYKIADLLRGRMDLTSDQVETLIIEFGPTPFLLKQYQLSENIRDHILHTYADNTDLLKAMLYQENLTTEQLKLLSQDRQVLGELISYYPLPSHSLNWFFNEIIKRRTSSLPDYSYLDPFLRKYFDLLDNELLLQKTMDWSPHAWDAPSVDTVCFIWSRLRLSSTDLDKILQRISPVVSNYWYALMNNPSLNPDSRHLLLQLTHKHFDKDALSQNINVLHDQPTQTSDYLLLNLTVKIAQAVLSPTYQHNNNAIPSFEALCQCYLRCRSSQLRHLLTQHITDHPQFQQITSSLKFYNLGPNHDVQAHLVTLVAKKVGQSQAPSIT